LWELSKNGIPDLRLIALMALMAVLPKVSAQEHTPPNGKRSDATTLFKSLEGAWHCTGTFSNGKKISSTLHFAADPNGLGLHLTHVDTPPNDYVSDERWGMDEVSGKLLPLAWTGVRGRQQRSAALYVADRFSATSVTFAQRRLLAPPWTPNRFRYVVAGRTLQIYWELQRDGKWQLGDRLECPRMRIRSVPRN
jgi:hypothetical protein